MAFEAITILARRALRTVSKARAPGNRWVKALAGRQLAERILSASMPVTLAQPVASSIASHTSKYEAPTARSITRLSCLQSSAARSSGTPARTKLSLHSALSRSTGFSTGCDQRVPPTSTNTARGPELVSCKDFSDSSHLLGEREFLAGPPRLARRGRNAGYIPGPWPERRWSAWWEERPGPAQGSRQHTRLSGNRSSNRNVMSSIPSPS